MWELDLANSGDLIDRLRPHGRNRNFEVASVGEGWLTLLLFVKPSAAACSRRRQHRYGAGYPAAELRELAERFGVL